MTRSSFAQLLVLALATAAPGLAQQPAFGERSYEYALSDVLPGASEFVRRDGYWEGLGTGPAGGLETRGYVVLSDDLVDIPGYSGHTLNTLIGLDSEGTLTGVRIVRHSEPIVLIGIPEEKIHRFTAQYPGRRVTDRILISDRPKEGYVVVDGISGATVTAVAENATILEAAQLVARAEGLVTVSEVRDRRPSPRFEPASWQELAARGAIANLRVPASELSLPGEAAVVDVTLALIDPPTVGRNLLGDRSYAPLRRRLDEHGGSALWIGGRGELSFKGPGFARGGIFDRFVVEQGGSLYVFKDLDYVPLAAPAATGAPAFREGGVFFLDGDFDPTAPFSLQLTIPYRLHDRRTYATFVIDYRLPASYIEGEEPFWVTRWRDSVPRVVFLVVLIGATAVAFHYRLRLVRWRKRIHLAVAVAASLVIGLAFKAQPSTTQILTLAGTAREGRFPIEVFLTEPLIFVFWITVVATLLLWGRGFFCGWLCPYGALLEALIQLWEKTVPAPLRHRLERWEPPRVWRFGKYLTLAVIVGVSFFSLPLAETLDEVEPFKTFVLGLVRPAPFVAYFVVITLVSVVSHRFFCRFLCPLGGAIATLSQRPASRLLRYDLCKDCKICARGCEPRAISMTTGAIDYRECLQCWDCQATARDSAICPALIRSAKEGRSPAVWTGTLSLLLLLVPAPLAAATHRVTPDGPSLSQVLATSAEGDEILVAPGVHRGTLVVDRPVALRGEQGAIIDAEGAGTVVAVSAPDVTIEGLTLRGCSHDLEHAHAAVHLTQSAVRAHVAGNTMTDCRFGVWVGGAVRATITGNHITGLEPLAQNDRGDCIHLTDAGGATVTGNVLRHCRDGIYMELGSGYRIASNRISASRYAVHTMWCDDSVYEGNEASGNLVGLALMFSTRVRASHNALYANSTHGMLLVQVTRSEATENQAIGNSKGLFVYNSLYNEIRGNLLARNGMGLHYWGGSEDNRLHANAFIDNQIQVRFIAAYDQTWAGNYWSDYQGWDVDGDDTGEVVYRSNTLVDDLLWRAPLAKLLLTSPALQLLALIERELPVITVPKALDPAPLMHPPMADWAETLARYPAAPARYYGKLEKLPHVPGGQPS